MCRDSNLKIPEEQYIAYTGGWCVCFTDPRSEAIIEFFRDGSWQSLTPGAVAIIPPFGLVHWRFPAGALRYYMYYWMSQYPVNFPAVASAMAFSGSIDAFLQDPQHLLAWIRANKKNVWIDRASCVTKLASLAHKLVIENFSTDETLTEICRRNQTSLASASRAFKNSFGIPLVRYRSLLRLMYSQELLIFRENKVTSIAFDVGFSDLSRFYRQFKSYAGTTPGSFLTTNCDTMLNNATPPCPIDPILEQ